MSKEINPEHFELKERNEEDFRKSRIARSHLTNEFTIEDVETQRDNLLRMQKELEAQIKVSKAVVDNIERNHKKIARLSIEDLARAAYLNENKNILQEAENKLKQVIEVIENQGKVLDTIYEKFGFVKVTGNDEETGDTEA